MTAIENSASIAIDAVADFKRSSHKPHRNKVKMVADVLESARNGALKTHIMYSSNLSYSNLNELLITLTENGMIKEEYDSGGRFPSMTKYFVTTSKGYRFLEQFRELYDLMNTPASQIENASY